MVPPKNAFLSLRLPIFGSSYYQCFYTFGIAPHLGRHNHHGHENENDGDGDDDDGDDDDDGFPGGSHITGLLLPGAQGG